MSDVPAVVMESCAARDLVEGFQHDVTGFCGCGRPEAMLSILQKHLEAAEPGSALELLGSDDRDLWIGYCLSAWRLTLHGGSVYGGWLSDDGKLLLEALRVMNGYA